MFAARSSHSRLHSAQVSFPSVRQTCTESACFEARATTPMTMPAKPEKPAPSSRILSDCFLGIRTSAFKIASAKSSSAGHSKLPVESIFSDLSLLTSFKSYWSEGTWNSRQACWIDGKYLVRSYLRTPPGNFVLSLTEDYLEKMSP